MPVLSIKFAILPLYFASCSDNSLPLSIISFIVGVSIASFVRLDGLSLMKHKSLLLPLIMFLTDSGLIKFIGWNRMVFVGVQSVNSAQ